MDLTGTTVCELRGKFCWVVYTSSVAVMTCHRAQSPTPTGATTMTSGFPGISWWFCGQGQWTSCLQDMNTRDNLCHQAGELREKVSRLSSIRNGKKENGWIFSESLQDTWAWAPSCTEGGAGRACAYWVGKWRFPGWQSLKPHNFWYSCSTYKPVTKE